MKSKRTSPLFRLAAACLLLAACSKREAARGPSAGPRPAAQPAALYYYDLGPAELDVSAYPPERREDYRLFAAVCGACHTLARPLNAPYAEEAVWQRFVDRMHGKMAARGVRLDPSDKRRIVSFLAFDSRVRKKERTAEFQRTQEELWKRFEAPGR